MGRISVVDKATLVIQSTVKAIDWVDQALEEAAAKKDAVQSLRDALAYLRDETEFYQTQLSRGDVTNLPSSRVTVDQNVNALEEALDHSKAFLDDFTRTNPPKSGLPSEPDLVSYLWQVEHHLKTNKIAFKLLWYSLRKDTFRIHRDVFAISHPFDDLADALNAASSLFKDRPFVAPGSTLSLPLNILNHNGIAIEQYGEMMRRAGKGWVEDRVRVESLQRTGFRNNDIDVLKQAQICLFEILWTKALEQWKVPLEFQMDIASGPPPYSQQEQAMGSELEPGLVPGRGAADDLEKLDQKLQASIFPGNKQTFTTAFCGMAKAGKSLFLSALIGTAILPSDEFPSTAWPCRVRHVEGQKEPELRYDQAPFLVALEKLRQWKHGSTMQQFKPPLYIDDDTPEDLVDKMKIWQRWNDLHAKSKDNLECFEDPQFQLVKSARGTEAVMNLLFQLNDIVRIYQRFGPIFGEDVTDWPLLTLEFPSLRGRKIQGIFEFIDLPGIGEHLQQFENLVKTVAKSSNAIVPIVSLLNMQHDGSLTTLPGIINACNLECSAVICTNLDRVDSDNEPRQNALVTGAFWPHRSAPPKPGIIRCSSLMGVSAQTLLAMSQNDKPEIGTFWKSNIGYHAAKNILGANGQKAYKRFDHDEWVEEIREQVTDSGLPDAIEVLFQDIVSQARRRVMMQELHSAYRVVCNFTSDYSRILEGARRTRAEYDRAKKEFERDKNAYYRLLREWKAEEAVAVADLSTKINRQLRDVETEANKLAIEAIRTVIQSRDKSGRNGLFGRKFEIKECSDQVWELKLNRHSLNEFLSLCLEQLRMSLDELRIKVTPAIEKLQQEACRQRAEALIARIKRSNFEGDALKQQIEQNIAYELFSPHFAAKVRDPQINGTTEGSVFLGLTSILSVAFAYFVTTSSAGLIAPIVVGAIGIGRLLVRQMIRTDAIVEVFRKEVVTPWVKEVEKKDGKVLIGTMTPLTESIFGRFITAEEARFKEELDQMVQPMGDELLRRNVMIYGNLVATKAALEELIHRTEACMPAD
ncbi:hypothetical protein FRC19_008722 [Serendipita sp. 401]|nr:hypothetical protein FRC19_008722 [Serendipita sp. 401]